METTFDDNEGESCPARPSRSRIRRIFPGSAGPLSGPGLAVVLNTVMVADAFTYGSP